MFLVPLIAHLSKDFPPDIIDDYYLDLQEVQR